MNVYDFDGTIYDGDSSVDFVRFCLRRHPRAMRSLPGSGIAALRHYGTHSISKTEMKQVFFRFLEDVPYVEHEVRTFWDSHMAKVGAWYMANHREDDVVISASPEFLLREVCDRLEIRHLIASDVDPRTGRFLRENTHGTEKPKLFYERFPGAHVDEFYSDLVRADWPMAEEADRAFVVTHGRLTPWPTGDKARG